MSLEPPLFEEEGFVSGGVRGTGARVRLRVPGVPTCPTSGHIRQSSGHIRQSVGFERF